MQTDEKIQDAKLELLRELQNARDAKRSLAK